MVSLRDLWCRCFHDEPMWPIHGKSTCRVCLREFPANMERVELHQAAGLTAEESAAFVREVSR